MLDSFLTELFSLRRKPDTICHLEHLKPVLDELGNPNLDFPAVHIAGTNGKGSVATKIAAALQASGKRVGLFTSPHLLRFHERIRVNGEEITDEQILELGPRVIHAAKYAPIPLHFFEITTLMAFLYFSIQRVEIAVFETGMGGLLDATNVVRPLLSVITSISRDHVERLGSTLDTIAEQKAGIIKQGVPVVLGAFAKRKPCLQKAEQLGCKVHLVEQTSELFEEENRFTARRAMEVLGIQESAITMGLDCTPACRFQEIDGVIFDVAHNQDGFIKLFAMFHHHFPHFKARLVLGLSEEKEIDTIVSYVEQQASLIHLVRADSPRATSTGRFQLSIPHSKEPSLVGGGLKRALLEKQHDEKIIVCGSFYVVSEAIASLKKWSSS